MVLISFNKMILLSSLTGTNVRGGMGAIVSKPAASSARCPVYYMIGARGTGEGPNGSIGYASLYEKVLSTVPGGKDATIKLRLA